MHGKYWHLTDINDDSGVPYGEISKKLNNLNYKGYIACEFEGHHFKEDIDTRKQLKRYVKLIM